MLKYKVVYTKTSHGATRCSIYRVHSLVATGVGLDQTAALRRALRAFKHWLALRDGAGVC